eukprot:gene149-761_t
MGCCCWKKTKRQVGCRNSDGVDLRDNLSHLYRRDSSGTRGQVPNLTKRKRRNRKRRQQPVDSSSSDTVDKNLRVLRVLPRQSSQSLQNLPNDGVLGLPGQVYGIPSKAVFEEPQKVAVEDASQDGYEADLSERADSTEIKEDSIEVKDHSIQVCSSVLEDILNAVSQRVAEAEVIARIRANFENNKEGEDVRIHSGDPYVIDAPDASICTCKSRNPNDNFEDAEPEIVIARFSISDYKEGETAEPVVEPETVIARLVVNNNNIEEDETIQPHSEDVPEICTESDSPCLDNGALAVQDTKQCRNEAQIANDQTTKETSFDDSNDIALSNVTRLAQAVPIESLEDTVVPVVENADVDQPESLNHLKNSKTESNICQPQQNTLEAEKDPVIVEVCSSFLEGILNAVCEEVEATNEVEVEQDGSDADGASSDHLGSSVKDAPDASCTGTCVSNCPISAQIVQVESLEDTVVPVVANADVDSVNLIGTSDQSLLANGSNIDCQRESLSCLEDSKMESNICQPQQNTLEAGKDPVIVEVCSSVVEGIVNAVCEEVKATNEVEVKQDGSDADGASSDYLGSSVKDVPDASCAGTCVSNCPILAQIVQVESLEDTVVPVVANADVDSVNLIGTSDQSLLANGSNIDCQRESLSCLEDSKTESNICQPPQNTLKAEKDRVIVEVCSSFVEGIVNAVCEEVVATNEIEVEQDGSDANGASSDYLGSSVMEAPDASTCTCENRNPTDYFEDTESPVEPEIVIARLSVSDYNIEEDETVQPFVEPETVVARLVVNNDNIEEDETIQPHSEDVSEICTKSDLPCLDNGALAVQDTSQCGNEAEIANDQNTKDKSFDDSKEDDIALSDVTGLTQVAPMESFADTMVPVVGNADLDSVSPIDTSDQSLLANESNIDDQRESVNHPQDSKMESNICQPQQNTLEAEKDPVIVEVCSSFVEGIVNAICEEVEATNEVEVEQDGSDADGASSDYLGSSAKDAPDACTVTVTVDSAISAQIAQMESLEDTNVPVVRNAHVDSVNRIDTSDQSLLVSGSNIDDQHQSLNHLQDSKTESNICQPPQNTLKAEKDRVIVVACSSFLEGILNAVCEEVEAMNEVEVEHDGSDTDGASSDYLGSCVMEAPDASTCTCENRSPTDYFEDTESPVEPEIVIARLSVIDYNTEEDKTVQPHSEDVSELCTESDSPCRDNGALAVQDTGQSGNEAQVANDQNTKDKCFDDSKEDDIALSDVTGLTQVAPMESFEDTMVPVVGNADLDSVSPIDTSDQSLLANESNIDDQRESVNHPQDSKMESNICQPQQNTLEAEKDPVIVEVCSSFLEGTLTAVCKEVEETNELEVEQGGSDADGASSDYLGSYIMEAPDASTCTCESRNPTDYFEDEEAFVEPETVIARLSVSNCTIEEGDAIQPFVEPEMVIARLTLSEDNFEEEDSVQPVWDFVLESCAEDRAAK